ncbi:hypothetical protein L596_024041 [Steinernema carpocapsae]|uniref:Uncharacterized protein n=1 Tax=Steinernema carpocapsae TaxID=34508 RepID=A0A4U5MFJ3_STECR|nr:hypothetical protein L596_024041 [Steinernema carpocapsae]
MVVSKNLAIILVALCAVVFCRRMDPTVFKASATPSPKLGDYKYNTSFLAGVPVNHFAAADDRTFTLKYLFNNDYYVPGGPIFFYTGNEGTIEGFAANTGMMWDLAPNFNASLLFVEHRYYGNGSSIPFENDAGNLTVAQLSYLTSELALADFVHTLRYFKEKILHCAEDTPVIAFGGSYGGMLAAWFRMKYPHVVDGAWAASAPLRYFHNGKVDPGKFENIVKNTYEQSGCNTTLFSTGWDIIYKNANTTEGQKLLNEIFHIDPETPINSKDQANNLIAYITTGLDYMAMTNYPYPSEFLTKMPGWPVQKACEALMGTVNPESDKNILKGIMKATMVYYNGSGTVKQICIGPTCSNTATAGLGSFDGWDWQECTEILIEMCSQGPPNDFELNSCATDGKTFDLIGFTKNCVQSQPKNFKSDFVKEDKIAKLYGLTMRAHSKIIFTGGTLDPWNSASITTDSPGMTNAAARELYSFQIQGSAHHLDLRQPNSCDPPSVTKARFQIYDIIFCWAYPQTPRCKNPFQQQDLPGFSIPVKNQDDSKCKKLVHQYPWGQKGREKLRPPPTTQGSCPNSKSTSKHYVSTTTVKSTTKHHVSTTTAALLMLSLTFL